MFTRFKTFFMRQRSVIAALVIATLPSAVTAFEVRIVSDDTIMFLEPGNAGAAYPFETDAEGRRIHTIPINRQLGYRSCKVDYRQARAVRVRWTPKPDFSDFAADSYDVILSIVEPSQPQDNQVTIELEPPAGFSRALLREYEQRQDGDGLSSIQAFFTTALLAQHFAHALPEGHGKTARMANASVDHLIVANQFLERVNLQPGWEYEDFVEQNAGTSSRAEKTVRALQGMNIAFFRDIRPAFVNISSDDVETCREGLNILNQLSQCHDDIVQFAPTLLSEVANVLNSNDPAFEDTPGFDFAARVREAEATCNKLEQDNG